MNITLIIPTLRRYDLLVQCVRSALAGSLAPTQIMVIDNGVGIPNHLRTSLVEATKDAGVALQLVSAGRNLGVAASWNLGLHQHSDMLIVSNDDVTLYESTIDRLVRTAEAEPSGLFFFPGSNGYKNAWSCFLQRRASLEIIGPYDEWISPGYGYYEDNDYSYRLRLAGYRHIPVARAAFGHVESATLKSMSVHEQRDHERRFALARQHYVEKWGGTPGQERYAEPFNGTPPVGYLRSAYEPAQGSVVQNPTKGSQHG